MNRVESKAQDDNRMEGNLKASRIHRARKQLDLSAFLKKLSWYDRLIIDDVGAVYPDGKPI